MTGLISISKRPHDITTGMLESSSTRTNTLSDIIQKALQPNVPAVAANDGKDIEQEYHV